MQNFFINKNSTLPILELKLINDGRHSTDTTFFDNLQDAQLYFTMTDIETGVVKVAHQPAIIIENDDCDGTFNIGYEWKERDTNREGKYVGLFEINFNGSFDDNFTGKKLIVPIHNQLFVNIISGSIKK
jgi:hypothetical protein